jgi:Domain of unknown function (DUF4216)
MKSKHFNKEEGVTDELYALACGPDQRVNHYTSCIIGGMRFHTRELEMQRRTQNSGIATTGYKGEEEIEYLGVLIDIIELNYGSNHSVFLFQCDWWDISNKKIGIHIDPYFTSVNFTRTWYQNEPYILATQAAQVIYLKDPKYRGDWHVVQKIIPRGVYDIPTRAEMDENSDIQEEEAFQMQEQTESNLLVDEELVTTPLNRPDLPPNEVEANFAFNLDDSVGDKQFINDDEIEDDTLVEYCDSEEDLEIEEDTDIDE